MATLTIADLDNGKRDLETVDAVANSSSDFTTTRYGDSVLTRAGALRRLGWQAPVPYAPGLNVDSPTMTVERDGIVYRPDPALVPFTTAEWNPDQWRVVQNTQDSGRVYQFPALGEAQAAAATLPDGASIIVEGESQGHVVSGAYVPDKGASSHVAELLGYLELEQYDGLAVSADVTAPGISGRFYRRGTAAANGGTVIKDALGRSWERDFSGPLNVRWFGADGTLANDATSAIKAAIAALNNTYEASAGIFFPEGVYKVTETIYVKLPKAASLTLFSDSRATIYSDVPDGDWTIDVDYSTGGTANFVSFNMTNIALSDLFDPRKVKNGLRTQRVVGSRFVQCDFNYLNIAVDMGADSNLNVFDSCQFRQNIKGWKSSDGISNNNIFLNCQWRYHSGTAFDSTNTDGNQIIGGDFEPGNASPVIIADSLTMQKVRFERNAVHGVEGIRVLSNCDLDVTAHSDGATQVMPLYNVIGSNNNLACRGGGATAVLLGAAARNNVTEIDSFKSLLSGGGVIYDCAATESSNILRTKGSMQGNSKTLFPEVYADDLIPADLTLWSKTNCTVTAFEGGYQILATGAGASISYTIPGTFSNIMVGMTTQAVSASGHLGASWSGGREYEVTAWPSVRKRVVACTFNNEALTNPVFKLSMPDSLNGAAAVVHHLRAAAGRVPN